MKFNRESLLDGLRDQTLAVTANLKLRRYFESSDLAIVFQELYTAYLNAEVNNSFDETEHFLFPIPIHAELICLSEKGLLKILAKFSSEEHRLISNRKKTREGTWIKINWRKFKRIIYKDNVNTFEEISKKHKLRRQEELEEMENSLEVDQLFDLWGACKANVTKPRKLEDNVRMYVAKSIDKFGFETIKEAITNLEKAFLDNAVNSWYTHKWTFEKFLKQSNGVMNWVGDNWDASPMNPKNQKESKDFTAVNEEDFIHENEEYLEDAIDSYNEIKGYIEGYNETKINAKTVDSVIDFINIYEEAMSSVEARMEAGVGPFNFEKFGSIAELECNCTSNHIWKTSTLWKRYLKYLELKVLTQQRYNSGIPISSKEFSWKKHIDSFYDYYTRSGINDQGIEHIIGAIKKVISKGE